MRLIGIVCCLVFWIFSVPVWAANSEVLYQTSTLNALMEGVYDGSISFKELRKHGDFGLGTFNGLDGEMIALDGKFYQVKSNGYAYPVSDSLKTPFSIVKFFRSEKTVYLVRSYNYDQLTRYLDSIILSKNLLYAIKIEGMFDYVKTRSVHKQVKPYSKFSEVLRSQAVFEFRNIKGTIVGFRTPEYFAGVNAPGYHFHFISEDRRFGGHLLGCETRDIVIYMDNSREFRLVLPDSSDFLKMDLMKESEVYDY